MESTTFGSLHPDIEIKDWVYKTVEKDLPENLSLLFRGLLLPNRVAIKKCSEIIRVS